MKYISSSLKNCPIILKLAEKSNGYFFNAGGPAA